ncbi:hypothetical protein LTR17_025801 [Elasticomyces elasticus]|nr:hypothetical protein LTR17_025801 [Elasticomyces elasticus]
MAPPKHKSGDMPSSVTVQPENSKPKSRTRKPPSTSRVITRGMANDAARQAVLTTAELLELILLQLPAQTVFGTQRVCRQFHDYVAASVLLQQKLFLRLPPQGTDEEIWTLDRLRFPNYAQLMAGIHETGRGEFVLRIRKTDDDPDIVDREILRQPATLANPFLKRVEPVMSLRERMERQKELFSLNLIGAELMGVASWKNTYLVSVPCKKVTLTLDWAIDVQPPFWGRVNVYNPTASDESNGFALGALLDVLLWQEHKPYNYAVAGKVINNVGILGKLIERLEKASGKKAVVKVLVIEMLDVIVVQEGERAVVKDI